LVETVIQQRQDDDYRALGEADRASDCSGFIVFMLDAIDDALKQALEVEGVRDMPVKAPVETQVKTLVETRVKTEDRLLAVFAAQPEVTLAEAASHLGKSVSAVERAVRRLRDSGRLRHVGPQKGGHWEVME
jgi:Fic family protein